MHTVLHPKDDNYRLYVSIKERVIVLTSTDDSVYASIRLLEDNIKKIKGRLITATRNNRNNTKIKTEIGRKTESGRKSTARDKQAKSHSRGFGMTKKGKPLERG